jgi:hypothetical protein
MPSLCIDDLVNALTFSEGQPVRAAEILQALDRRDHAAALSHIATDPRRQKTRAHAREARTGPAEFSAPYKNAATGAARRYAPRTGPAEFRDT